SHAGCTRAPCHHADPEGRTYRPGQDTPRRVEGRFSRQLAVTQFARSPSHHSRRDIAGSMWAARRAGIHEAQAATIASTEIASVSARGSPGEISKSIAESTRR